MENLADLVARWQNARKELIEALAKDDWTKPAKKGGREVVSNILDPYWVNLSNAETNLYRWRADNEAV